MSKSSRPLDHSGNANSTTTAPAASAAPWIPYSRPSLRGHEMQYLKEVLEARHFQGDGSFTKRCNRWLEDQTRSRKALLTHSCTAALEISAILADIGPGDEVIMPSFTFVSTANAVVLRGGVPVFIDIRPDTLNIDEKLIEAAITPRTKAIFVVHYAGIGAEMDTILGIAKRRNLLVLEDAAQGLMASYKGKALGAIGHVGSLSFHDTKNLVSGEGGALLINDERFAERAEILREKGTNRQQFLHGLVDKYTWVDVGSSYLPSEFNAAVLLAQLEDATAITQDRIALWDHYHDAFAALANRGCVSRPTVPAECQHNGHIYYLLTASLDERNALIRRLKECGIGAPFHYVPLHSAPAGRRFGRTHGSLAQTDHAAERLLRLPIWPELDQELFTRIVESVYEFYRSHG